MASKRALEFSPTPKSSKKFRNRDSASPIALSPTEIEKPENKATVHALLTSLSPTKKTDTYFQGELTDGQTVIPLIRNTKLNSKN